MKYISKCVRLMLLFCIGVFCLGIDFIGATAAREDDFRITDGILTAYMGDDMTVTVPDGVTEIGKSAFEKSKVVKAILPSTVTKIGEYAFYRCKELEHIELPDSIETIGNQAFAYCKKLESIELPESITKLGIGAFMNSGLTSVALPSSLNKINGALFRECKKLKSVQMPENLESIGGMAFRDCYSLEKVVIPQNVTSIGLETFSCCYKLKKIVIYSDKITKVRRNPFFFHAPDRKVVFKKKVAKKYKKKFNYQDYMTKGAVLYHKTSASTVDMCAVKYTKKGKLIVPEKIGKYTVTGVKGADGMSSIVIGSLYKGITEVVLADTIQRLENDVFWMACFSKIKFPKNLTYIGDSALYGNHLEKITLPDKLEYIGYKAFAKPLYSSDKNIIPDGVDKLSKSIFIPKSVTTIEDGNFGFYELNYPLEDGEDGWDNVKIPDYTIKGYKGSYAQKYAKKHGLKFAAK